VPGGDIRLAAGSTDDGPRSLLEADLTIDDLLSGRGPTVAEAAASTSTEPVPDGTAVLAPVGSQEVWAAGVTYERSRRARAEEALEPSPYDRVYTATRPELFHKAAAWRVRGPGEPIGVRRDSEWNVPEPELALVLDARMAVVGYTVGNDVSSRTIEGENSLYLPQAKTYDGACALGPGIVPAGEASPPFDIRLEVCRGDEVVFDEVTSTATMVRSFEELTWWLGRALVFPFGAVLLTGTGLVPPATFSLGAGDLVRIDVSGIGVLDNVVEEVGSGPGAPPPRADPT
jgi:2-dehydro-3-deoxy-D-arabinonate dehydratase